MKKEVPLNSPKELFSVNYDLCQGRGIQASFVAWADQRGIKAINLPLQRDFKALNTAESLFRPFASE